MGSSASGRLCNESGKFLQGVADTLRLYVRHLAWLQSKPDKSDKTRVRKLLDEGGTSSFLRLPDVGYAEYLLAAWHDSGRMLETVMGQLPISWSEIQSWISVTKASYTNEEIRLIREMSRIFVESLYEFKDPKSPPPFSTVRLTQTEASDKIGSILRSMAKRRT